MDLDFRGKKIHPFFNLTILGERKLFGFLWKVNRTQVALRKTYPITMKEQPRKRTIRFPSPLISSS